MNAVFCTLCAALLLAGCAQVADVRSRLRETSLPDPALQEVQFVYLGEIVTREGRFYVATQHLVIRGMLSPRGVSRLLLFDRSYGLVAEYSLFGGANPGWCEGSRIYLLGLAPMIEVPPAPELAATLEEDIVPFGNVIEFVAGPTHPVLTREFRYGSSGGITEDPWAPEAR